MTHRLLGLAIGLTLAACSNDGYVSVRITPRPAPAEAFAPAGLTASDEARDTDALLRRDDGALAIALSETSGRHLYATVTEVNLKVKGTKKHKKHHGHCNDGVENGGAHEGDEQEDGDHDEDADHEDADNDNEVDEGGDGGGHHKSHNGGWTRIFEGSQRVDLFDTSAAGAFLAGGDVPQGRLKEIRLVLSDDIELVEGNTSSPVRCPSCSTSGFKIKTHRLEVIDGGELALSVDLSHSLRQDESGGWVLHPVIHLRKASCDEHDDEPDDDDEHGDDD